MTVLNIYSLDDTEQQNIIACLPEGRHVIGRGGVLQVTDKRVSRSHAVINVTNDKITLISCHINPCFFRAFNGNNLTVITQNQESELNEGDQFALLPDAYWYKVKIKREEPQANGKRLHDIEQQEVVSKKAKLSTDLNKTDENEQGPSKATETTLNDELEEDKFDSSFHFQETAQIEDLEREVDVIDAKQEPIENNLTTEVKEEPNEQSTSTGIKENPQEAQDITNQGQSNNGDNTKQESKSTDNEQGTNDIQPSATASSFQGQPNDNDNTNPRTVRRERCWYRERCFRKNPNHRQSFSHPGDPDYQSDPDYDRPDCPYGIYCYRKNIDHRQEYKHAAPPAPRPTGNPPAPPPITQNTVVNPPSPPNTQNPPTKKKAARTRKKAKPPLVDDDSEEDYDYNDPFINDGSSDDFQPTDSNSSDSEWDDSQEVEESQERNRMLQEAKKFTRKKN